jgi:hypothetical protein
MEVGMDATLLKLFGDETDGMAQRSKTLGVEIDFIDETTGQIELVHPDRREPYTLKPLGELYGPGNSGTVDPQSHTFMPLFLCIEEEIAKFDANEKRLDDAEVSLALNSMGMSPEAPSADPLIQHVQCALRMNLSLNNYSRQELRQALRKIGRSVDRHMEGGRGRGYLNFIQQFVGKARGR